jgi:hypothetical protein
MFFIFLSLRHIVNLGLGEVLGEGGVVGSAESHKGHCFTSHASFHKVGTNDHSLSEGWKIHFVEISSTFGVHLFQNIAVDSKTFTSLYSICKNKL